MYISPYRLSYLSSLSGLPLLLYISLLSRAPVLASIGGIISLGYRTVRLFPGLLGFSEFPQGDPGIPPPGACGEPCSAAFRTTRPSGNSFLSYFLSWMFSLGYTYLYLACYVYVCYVYLGYSCYCL